MNKHISKLKRIGYEIEAVPHRGYRLKNAPDVLFDFEIKSLLKTQIFGSEVYYFSEISSTQDYCRQLGEEGHSEGAVVIAEVQTRGRGRLGREWISPKGGLWFSLLLRPEGIGFESLGLFPLMAALAGVKAIEEKTKLKAGIKWPNDLLVRNRKVGGVLAEIQSELEKIHSVQLGVGLNVNNSPPAKALFPATSLFKESGARIRRADILVSFLLFFERYYSLFKEGNTTGLLKEVEQKLLFKGEEVVLKTSQGREKIQVIKIDSLGRLVGKKNGRILKLVSGEIEF